MLTTLLLAHAFAYCSGNPIYDSPGGRVVEFQQPVGMVIVAHDWDDGWVEVFPTDGWGNRIPTNTSGWIVDGEQSYWMRMDGCWGERVGV
jgi:hypothetical protein